MSDNIFPFPNDDDDKTEFQTDEDKSKLRRDILGEDDTTITSTENFYPDSSVSRYLHI